MKSMGIRSGRTMALVLAAAVALLAASLGGVARADTSEVNRYEVYQRALAASPQQSSAPSYGFYGSDCYADAGDDVVLLQDETSTPAAFDPADVLEYCVGLGDTLVLTLDVDTPRDPATDESFKGITFVSWSIDVDNNGFSDYFAVFYRNADGDLVGEIADLTQEPDENGQAPIACDSSDGILAQFDDGTYVLRDIPSSCIGGDATTDIRADGAITLDDNGDGDPDGGDVYFDVAPNEQVYPDQETPAADSRATDRVGGADRFETSALISQRQFPQGADVVYLAEAALFADAVSGGVLTDGPILLVPSSGPVPEPVLAEVRRVAPDRVVGLGGTAAIDDGVLQATAQGRPTSRLAGPNRIATSTQIARAQFPNGADRVFLARADVFADAVAAGILTQGPIVLVPNDGQVPEEVRDVIDELDPETVTALGGTAAISEGILEAAAAERDSDRIFGANRIATAIAISEFQFGGMDTDVVYLARADIFADAVVGGTLTDGPILLVPTCGQIPLRVVLEIQERNPDTVIALGGTAAICADMLTQAGDV